MELQQPATRPVRILVPWDGLTPINQVVTFARSLGGPDAALIVLPVVQESTSEGSISEGIPQAHQAGPAATRPPIEVLDPPDAATDPASAIAAVAAGHSIDLIVMATPCQTSRELDPSCLAAQIALDSPTPVMVVHFTCDNLAAFPPSITRLLIPLDGSTRAAQVLPFAIVLAGRLGAPVKLVMVIDPSRVLPPAYAYDSDATSNMVASLTHDAHWALGQAERMLTSQQVEVRSDLLYGPVIPTLEAAVEPGDVIVMTTHGIGGAPRDRLGSVAARLLTDVPGPMVIMRGTPPAEEISGNGRLGQYEPISRPTA